jgi:hypothetical protein
VVLVVHYVCVVSMYMTLRHGAHWPVCAVRLFTCRCASVCQCVPVCQRVHAHVLLVHATCIAKARLMRPQAPQQAASFTLNSCVVLFQLVLLLVSPRHTVNSQQLLTVAVTECSINAGNIQMHVATRALNHHLVLSDSTTIIG